MNVWMPSSEGTWAEIDRVRSKQFVLVLCDFARLGSGSGKMGHTRTSIESGSQSTKQARSRRRFAQSRPTLDRCRRISAELAPRVDQIWAGFGQLWTPVSANSGPDSTEFAAELTTFGPKSDKFGPMTTNLPRDRHDMAPSRERPKGVECLDVGDLGRRSTQDRPRIDPKRDPDRPSSEPRSTADRPHTHSGSSLGRPQPDPRTSVPLSD